MDFAVHAARMDDVADEALGDVVLYAVDGANGAPYVEMKARILQADPAAGWESQDEAKGIRRLRIARSKVENPSRDDRVQCTAKLGPDTYRPANKSPVIDGRYWLVDLQRV